MKQVAAVIPVWALALACALWGPSLAGAQGPPTIDLGLVAPTNGTISYDGIGGPLYGLDIDVDNVVGLNTPMGDGQTRSCVDCVLSFMTGPFSGNDATTWYFGDSGSILLTGGIDLDDNGELNAGDVPAGTTILEGVFLDAATVTFFAGTFRILGAALSDTKDGALTDFYGMPTGTAYEGGLNLSFRATGTPGSGFSSSLVFSGDLFNTGELPTPTPTETPSSTPTNTLGSGTGELPTPTSTETETVTATPTSTATGSPTQTLTDTATATPTGTPVATSTETNTVEPTETPTVTATASATASPTEVCYCPPVPVSGCRLPSRKRALRIRDRISDDYDMVRWRWRADGANGTIPVSEFGDPLTTSSYALCIYDGTPPTLVMALCAPAGGICPPIGADKPCWKEKIRRKDQTSNGFRYGDSAATPSGIKRLRLRVRPKTLADIVVRAHGPDVPIPIPPAPKTLPLDLPVIAQLVKSDGPECWQSNYSTSKKSNQNIFFGKND